MNVRCDVGDAGALTALVRAERQRELQWWTHRRAALAADLTAAQRAAAVVELQAEFERLRAVGELRGTRTWYVLPAVRVVMAARGFTGRRWRPVPPRLPGRPWGTHDQHLGGRVTLYLPDDLTETLTRACYWTSAPAVARLQTWYDEFGDHWRGRLHNPTPRFTRRPGPSDTDLAQRERLVATVVTTGQVLREAIKKAIEPDPGATER